MLAVSEILVSAFSRGIGFEDAQRTPRVDVYELARRAGAETVLSSKLVEDGRVDETSYRARILLLSRPPEPRRRFTLAHELAHLVLSEPEVLRLVHATLNRSAVDVERLCNAFAAELLMPRRWIEEEFAGASERLDVLDDVVDRADVSVSAALTRLAIVLQWRSSLIYFQRRRDWAPVVIAGNSIDTHCLEATKQAVDILAAVNGSESRVHESIELTLRGRPITVSGELRRSAAGVLCLARPAHARS